GHGRPAQEFPPHDRRTENAASPRRRPADGAGQPAIDGSAPEYPAHQPGERIERGTPPALSGIMRTSHSLAAVAIGFLASFAAPASADPAAAWNALAEGNQRFAAGLVRDRHLVPSRNAVLAGAHPRAIVLGCSDSRVSPEIVFDQGLGDLWVVRTA